MDLRTVNVTRYIMPLREGGSLPALAEADDDFKYVVKFRGQMWLHYRLQPKEL